MIGQQDTTHILTADINFSSKQNLQKLISTTLSRWNVIKAHTEWNEHIYYDDTVAKKTNRLSNDTYLFEVETMGPNTYEVSMSVFGSRYRRGGSSMDLFERLMDALEVQLLHPDTVFAKMNDCYNLAYPPLELDFLNSGLEEVAHLEAEALEEDLEAVEDESSEADEDLDDASEAGDMPLSKMTDDQIADYSEALGRAPREEIDEWALNYEGGPILRYSYVKFTGTTVTDQMVDDITITGAIFNSATLKNCRFSNVHFYECDFTDVKIKNTKFKKCNFFDCELPQYVKVEHSCLISNM